MTILSSVVLLGGEVSSVQVSQTPVSRPRVPHITRAFLEWFCFPPSLHELSPFVS